MNVNLYDVLTAVGTTVSREVELTDVKENFYGEELYISSKAPFTLNIECVSKDVVMLECDAVISAVRKCSRCLTDVECEYPISIKRRVNVSTREMYIDNASETDAISYIEDCTLDVDRLVLDELFTILPMSVLCKEDCKGICKVCGTNLNESVCDCDQTVPDPRLAVFGEIFNQFNDL